MESNLVKYFEDYSKDDKQDSIFKDIDDLNSLLETLQEDKSNSEYENNIETSIIISKCLVELFNLDITRDNKNLNNIKNYYIKSLDNIIDSLNTNKDLTFKNIKQIIERLIINLDKY